VSSGTTPTCGQGSLDPTPFRTSKVGIPYEPLLTNAFTPVSYIREQDGKTVSSDNDVRIVGGTAAGVGDFPWQVSFR